MFFRRDPEPESPPPSADKSLATRIAWTVLLGGAALVVLRCSLATVVEIHGDGMAPNLLSGDHVLFVRGTWGIRRGDLVVYDPVAPAPPPAPERPPELPGERSQPGKRPHSPGPRDRLRNAAVVDPAELGMEGDWKAVQARSGVDQGGPPRTLRVARVLAVPGDLVTFGDPRGALGLAVGGAPLAQKPAESVRLGPAKRASAFENLGDLRYQVLASSAAADLWPGVGVPAEGGPYEIPAEGYLLVADNRDEGACCDSRAIGWVSPEQIRGEIVLRLGGSATSE